MTERREFQLPPDDVAFLNSLGRTWETISSQEMQWLLIHDYPLNEGYSVEHAMMAFKIESGYPRIGLDMVYFYPSISRKDNVQIGALTLQAIDSKPFQRWSRHRTALNPWRVEVDNISTHLSMVNHWLEREFIKKPSPL